MSTQSAFSETNSDKSGHLRDILSAAQTEYGLVGVGAVIATPEDGILALAVTGARAKGGEPVAPGDAWHIGSNTKMLTALGWGRLVDAGGARWGMTLGEIFEGDDLAPGWRDVTIEELLAHRSGAAANPGGFWMLGAGRNGEPVARQRAKLVDATLKQGPPGTRGAFVYSNLGYIIAGRAMEKVAGTGETYEQLMWRLVIKQAPDGAGRGFGFGPPKAIQGHKPTLLGGMKPAGFGQEADNAPAFASAGTAHISLEGHARLLLSFLEGPDALPAAMRQKLMTPYPDAASDYALGWGVQTGKDGSKAYLHAGSNTMWLSQVVVLPEPGAVIIVNTNQAGKDADAAIRKLTGELIEWVKTGTP
ncbi:beta-lactamase family protein [Hyphomonas sp. WL0036]|uniref:serine hydrolase domain-containing protein n=1 Tax=Hyphomonas sediminis TaxID=2866160 RepID=UPI001C7FA322|nr:serine hydrolase domain-containing protein [Hyphomonas sediminis]MBY9066490.1 beta-lactamase family protein [Hyphomonas sediminis]